MKRLIITLLLAALALCPQPLEAGSGAARVRGVASAPVDMSYLDGADFSLFLGGAEHKAVSLAAPASDAEEEISTLPPSYDLREKGWNPPLRDQGNSPLCWAFASAASIESNLALHNGYGETDVSEYLFGYMSLQDVSGDKPSFTWTSEIDVSSDGITVSQGTYSMAAAFLARGDGPVSEASAPLNMAVYADYEADEYVYTYSFYRPSNFTPLAGLRAVYSLGADRDAIKRAIMEYGAVYCELDADDDYFLYYDAYFKSEERGELTHAVAIVGWDDTYNKDNFKPKQPGSNGAWIVRDSAGSDVHGGFDGDGYLMPGDGYFYLSYEEGSLANIAVYVMDARINTNEYIYEYDPCGRVGMMSADGEDGGYSPIDGSALSSGGATHAWGANVYTARRGAEITSAGFYAASPATEYKITIEATDEEGSPRGEILASAEGTLELPGYSRIDFPTPARVEAGEKFSVVLEINSPGYGRPLAYEYAMDNYSEKAKPNPGKSFYSADGENWTSMGERGDLCIKAFAAEYPASSGGGCSSGVGAWALLTVPFAFVLFRIRRKK